MRPQALRAVHRTAVEVYGAFLEECVVSRVAMDRDGPAARRQTRGRFVDGRPVRLLTISGKGGWSPDSTRSEVWAKSDNVSLLDHLLSVGRGALMFWLADAANDVRSDGDQSEIEARARALVSIAFLHDIDKDLGLSRGAEIGVDAVAERMARYGIDEFLAARGVRLSPAAMLNYVEQVEGTQAAATRAAPDFDRRIAAVCPYIELADKLDGAFARFGIEGVRELLERWQGPGHGALTDWAAVEVHDHLHGFLLDKLQTALSKASLNVAGFLPLIEVVHDGRLLCLLPAGNEREIKRRALEIFLDALPYRLRFAVNNRLACEFVGGRASWAACREAMKPERWEQAPFANLLALPRAVAQERRDEIDLMFSHAGMETSWGALEDGAPGASAKPAIDHPGGDRGCLEVEPAHALAFLAIALNHKDEGRGTAPDAASRERQLSELLGRKGQAPPQWLGRLAGEDRARRVLLAIWTVAAVWRLEDEDRSRAAELLDCVLGAGGLVQTWIDGGEEAEGLAGRIRDTSGEIAEALERRFGAYLDSGSMPAVAGRRKKRCFLCNEPVSESGKVSSASRAHGVKISAFSGRDGRNDHLARPAGDTHLCPVCLAELQLRSAAQSGARMGGGDLPPLVSSPMTTGLFGGLAYQDEHTDSAFGLHDLNRLDVRKGRVYQGLDCQRKRIRVARLEPVPVRDEELVARLVMMLKAVRRLGRPIHVFRGAPSRHPAIWHFDALPPWLVRALGGDSLRIEQLPQALRSLELFDNISKANGLGVGLAKRALDPCRQVRLGALCVAWGRAVEERRGKNGGRNVNWATIEIRARERALSLLGENGGGRVNLSDSDDPLVRLAWLASRIQKRRGSADSTNKQLLCWKTAIDFVPAAARSVSRDETALILGLAGRLEEDLGRRRDAAARKHRDGEPLSRGCLDFANHFVRQVWGQVFGGKEPASQQQRHAAAIYRFALLESYSSRGIPEPDRDVGESDG